MESQRELDFIINQYKEACSYSLSFNKMNINDSFPGSNHLTNAMSDITKAFKNEVINETNFLSYIVAVQELKTKRDEAVHALDVVAKREQTIKTFIDKLKGFSEQFRNYIGLIQQAIDDLLRNSCNDNLKLHNLLCSDNAPTYMELKNSISEKDNPIIVSEFSALILKKAEDQHSIENLVFLKNKALYFKRQARFKTNALHYQLELCKEAKNHFSNIKRVVNDNMRIALQNLNLNSFGDFELKNIYYALNKSKYCNNKKEEDHITRSRCLSFINSFVRKLVKEDNKKEEKN